MTTLLKLDTKKNNGVLFDNKNKVIKKFYLKNKNFNREFDGYKWYLSKLNKKILLEKKFNSFLLPVFKGKNFNFWQKLIFETQIVEKVIEHYKYYWPKKKYVPYHGDLTIENIIFLKKKEPVFIDWEHFRKKEEWGLDISYFLISLIALPALTFNKREIELSQLIIFKELWKNFFLNKKFSYLENPIENIKKRCSNKSHFIFKITNQMKKQINETIL